MKKLTAIILAILMLVSFAACGGKDDAGKENTAGTAAILGREAYDDAVADNDLTLVNVWATWCTPCVNELPELQKVDAEYRNVAVVGILFDGVNPDTLARDEDTIKIGEELMNSQGASYTVVVPDEKLFTTFCSDLMYFPTSFFVDSEGNIVGQPIIGANNFDSWCEYIDAALGK